MHVYYVVYTVYYSVLVKWILLLKTLFKVRPKQGLKLKRGITNKDI